MISPLNSNVLKCGVKGMDLFDPPDSDKLSTITFLTAVMLIDYLHWMSIDF